jgi:hypothetical protein
MGRGSEGSTSNDIQDERLAVLDQLVARALGA